jgi:predicted MFS family arabinose efflux permease
VACVLVMIGSKTPDDAWCRRNAGAILDGRTEGLRDEVRSGWRCGGGLAVSVRAAATKRLRRARWSSAGADQWGALRDVLRLPDVRRLELGWGLSLVGYFASTIALFVYAFDEGGATLAAIYGVARAAPGAIITPVLLGLTDRVPVDRLLRVTTGSRAALVALAGAAAALHASPAVVLTLASISASMTATFRPAQASALPWLARTPAELTAANVAATMSENCAALLGPALAGVVLAVAGVGAALAVAAAFLAGAVFALWRLRMPAQTRGAGKTRSRGPLRDIAAGVASLVRIARPAGYVVLGFAQAFVRGALLVLLVVVALDVLSLGNGAVGWLNAAIGAGGLIGAALAARLAHLTRLGRCFVLGVALWGLPLVALGVISTPAAAYLALVVVGAGNAVEDASAFTLMPRLLGSRNAAPAMGAFELVVFAGVSAGSLAAPAISHWLGPRGALVAIGGALALLAMVYVPRFVQIDRTTPVPVPEIALLRGLPTFAPLPVATVDQLATVLERREYRPGEAVMREGDHGDRFHVIIDGRAHVTVRGRSVRYLQRGDCFGEIALLRDVPRTATVTATETLHTVALARADYLAAVTGNRLSARAALDLADERLAATSQ